MTLPEPKPLVIVILAAAGAIGGILTTCAASFPHVTFDQFDIAWGGLHGGGIGLAVGVTMTMARRLWVQAIVGPILGLMARITAARFYAMDIHGEPMNAVASRIEWLSGIAGGAWMVLWMVLASHLLFRTGGRKGFWTWSLTAFLIGGAIARGVVPRLASMEWVVRSKGLWLGAGFGLVMFVAAILVRALDRKYSRDDSLSV